LFFIYWAILGGVTPPTCTAAVAAAGIAKANWVKTGFMSVKLGAVAFILPFFFMINPALVGRSNLMSILSHGTTAAIGAVSIAYSLFGIPKTGWGYLVKATLFIGGILLMFPGYRQSIIGIAIVGAALAFDHFVVQKRRVAV